MVCTNNQLGLYMVEFKNKQKNDVFGYTSGYSLFNEMSKWCDENLKQVVSRYSSNSIKFFFSSESDRTLFLLRWS